MINFEDILEYAVGFFLAQVVFAVMLGLAGFTSVSEIASAVRNSVS